MAKKRLSKSQTPAQAGPVACRADETVAIETERVALLERLQQTLDYRFRDIRTLDLALTHSSVAYEEKTSHSAQNDNEQLEFLGDAVLGLVVAEHLVCAYPEFTEGQLTRLRAQFVSRQHLGRVGQSLTLGDYLRLGKGEEKSGGRTKPAILANALEAVVAAVYLDGGLRAAARFACNLLLDEKLDKLAAEARSGACVGDHKSMLQEYSQAHGFGQPRYVVTSEYGPDHRKSFVVVVRLAQSGGRDESFAPATGTRKKHAEQEAARIALEHLRSGEPDEQSQAPEGSR